MVESFSYPKVKVAINRRVVRSVDAFAIKAMQELYVHNSQTLSDDRVERDGALAGERVATDGATIDELAYLASNGVTLAYRAFEGADSMQILQTMSGIPRREREEVTILRGIQIAESLAAIMKISSRIYKEFWRHVPSEQGVSSVGASHAYLAYTARVRTARLQFGDRSFASGHAAAFHLAVAISVAVLTFRLLELQDELTLAWSLRQSGWCLTNEEAVEIRLQIQMERTLLRERLKVSGSAAPDATTPVRSLGWMSASWRSCGRSAPSAKG